MGAKRPKKRNIEPADASRIPLARAIRALDRGLTVVTDDQSKIIYGLFTTTYRASAVLLSLPSLKVCPMS